MTAALDGLRAAEADRPPVRGADGAAARPEPAATGGRLGAARPPGLDRLSAGHRPRPATARFPSLLGGETARVTVRGEAVRAADDARIRLWSRRPLRPLRSRRARHGRSTRLSLGSLRYARTRQFEEFLANPDPEGVSTTSYVYETAAPRARDRRPGPRPADDSGISRPRFSSAAWRCSASVSSSPGRTSEDAEGPAVAGPSGVLQVDVARATARRTSSPCSRAPSGRRPSRTARSRTAGRRPCSRPRTTSPLLSGPGVSSVKIATAGAIGVMRFSKLGCEERPRQRHRADAVRERSGDVVQRSASLSFWVSVRPSSRAGSRGRTRSSRPPGRGCPDPP